MEDSSSPTCCPNAASMLSNHCVDDSISAASASDVQDRLSSLELRVQQQEDELTVMKAALADVLRRLALSEDTAAKKQQSAKGQTPLREAYSMSCITNGSSGGRKAHSSTVSVARKETLSSAAKSGGDKKKDKPPMEGIKEKEEPPPSPQANDKPPSTPSTPQTPSPSSHPPSPHPPQPPRPAPESKGASQAKRFLAASTARVTTACCSAFANVSLSKGQERHASQNHPIPAR